MLLIQPYDLPIIQYRNKNGANAERIADLQFIRNHFRGTLIVNDAIDLVEYADGLHIGQEDLSGYDPDPVKAVATIRAKIGRKMLGLSTHNLEEVKQANLLDIDYIGLGAYRSTGTKSDASVGGDALLEIAKSSKHPVALIGGVKANDYFDESIRYKVIGSGLLEL